MAAQLSLDLARSLRTVGLTACSQKLPAILCLPNAPFLRNDRFSAERLPNPTGASRVSRTRALRNPTRHSVTIMAPQDFPLCAAFQEE